MKLIDVLHDLAKHNILIPIAKGVYNLGKFVIKKITKK